MNNLTIENLEKEILFKTSRSSGKGGQNVNKVSSKVEAYFSVELSVLLTEYQKEKVLKKHAKKISKEGFLKVVVQAERSQLFNKRIAVQKMFDLITTALKETKKRIGTKPSRASKEKRLKEKKQKSEIKKNRNEY